MVDKFFCTVAPDQDDRKSDDDEQALVQTFSGGPSFVKSTETTLFQEEEDIRQSKQMKIKVTFAKPRVKPVVSQNADKNDNFVKKNSAETRQKNEKLQQLETKVAEVYGSKAYKMLQKMSLKANKKDYDELQDESAKNDQPDEKTTNKEEFSLGKGIGKHGQGILNPIEPSLRPPQGGVGSAPKPQANKGRRGQKIDDEVDNENVASTLNMDVFDKEGEKKKEEDAQKKKVRLDAEDKAFLDLFKKDRRRDKSSFKQRYEQMQSKFKVEHGPETTIDQDKTAASLSDTMKRLNIIDMTGSKTKVEASALQLPKNKVGSGLLLKKILKIKDEAKFNVKALVQREEYQENLKLQIEQERNSLLRATKGITQVINELKGFQLGFNKILAKVDQAHGLQDPCAQLFKRYPTVYSSNDATLIVAQKFIAKNLAPFNFATSPLLNFDTFLTVRNLLTIGCGADDVDHEESRAKSMAFMQLLFDTHWVQPFRTYVMGHLDLRSPQGLLARESLTQWTALMPDEIIKKVVQLVLMPKLQQTLEKSDVKTAKVEDWLTPWCDIIGKKNMKTLFEVVKIQIAPVFSDKRGFKDGAYDLFAPWVKVLDSHEVISFANRNIIPKLTSLVKKLEVDPSDQKLQPLVLLFKWAAILPTSYSIKQTSCIVRDFLLSKLLTTLQAWFDIVDSESELQEILVWYTGWKTFLLEENGRFVEQTRVEEAFYLMMLMIDNKVNQLQ